MRQPSRNTSSDTASLGWAGGQLCSWRALPAELRLPCDARLGADPVAPLPACLPAPTLGSPGMDCVWPPLHNHWKMNCHFLTWVFLGGSLPRKASLVVQSVKNLLAMQETCFRSLVGKIPWSTKWLSTPVFLPGEPHRRGTWWSAVHGVTKSQTRLSDLHFHSPERMWVSADPV